VHYLLRQFGDSQPSVAKIFRGRDPVDNQARYYVLAHNHTRDRELPEQVRELDITLHCRLNLPAHVELSPVDADLATLGGIFEKLIYEQAYAHSMGK
jgi:hypothetical protein